MDTDTLKQLVRAVAAGYVGKVLNGYSTLTQDADGSIYRVVDVGHIQGKHQVGISLVVRVVSGKVIVERDQNDKPVVDALVQAGIARENIILAYLGDPVPEGAF